MRHWEYKELIEAIQETYEELLEEDRGYRYALAKLADEFDNLGKIEDVIVDLVIGEIAMKQEKVFAGRVEGITKRLNMFNLKDAEGYLTVEEMDDLVKRVNRVIEGLGKVEVDYDSSVE
ncbi:Imm3 family immunity protein [Metabacillus niabensis]|uniref:Immunity protein Imm3 n=1 Tax=Metabacillus niabensis TaxID=324854 RepID=A0ABT9Z4V4_9BACI|nr:Imm3 family immunity protein [Metabacillus niabensis]MDQ0227252.1 hypothetical protein [Metabacillus niabensis]